MAAAWVAPEGVTGMVTVECLVDWAGEVAQMVAEATSRREGRCPVSAPSHGESRDEQSSESNTQKGHSS